MPGESASWPYIAVGVYSAAAVLFVVLFAWSVAGGNVVGAAFWLGMAAVGVWLAVRVWGDHRGWYG